jgi:Immunity protein 53
MDNPGWHFKVELGETDWRERVIPPEEISGSDDDWVTVQSDGSVFEAFGGSGKLQELLERFRSFSVEQDQFLES